MKQTVNTKWLENMAFESEVNGHKLIIDATPEVGGEDRGPRPKILMLTALAGCTGMDVVSILKKMRVKFDDLNIKIEAELRDEHPKRYTAMHVIYEFKGKDLPIEKLEKAVNLSQDRYCGVNDVYRQVMDMTSEIRIVE